MAKQPEVLTRVVSTFDQRFYYAERKVGKKTESKYLDSITHTIGQVRRKPYLERLRADRGNIEMDRTIDVALLKGSNEHLAFDTLSKGGTVILNDPKRPAYTYEEIEAIKQQNEYYCILSDDQQMLEVIRMVIFTKLIKPKIISSEFTLTDWDEGCAGTCDAVWQVDGGEYKIVITEKILKEIFPKVDTSYLNSLITKEDIIEIPKGQGCIDWKTGKGFDADEYSIQISSYIAMGEFDWGLIVWTNNGQKKKGIQGLSTLLITKEQSKEYWQDFKDLHKHYIKYYRTEPVIYDIPTQIKL